MGGWTGAPGRALGPRSAFLPAPTRRVQRPFVATFRNASEVPGTGGLAGGEEARAVRARAPRER